MRINREGYRAIGVTLLLAAVVAVAAIVWLPCWLAWILGISALFVSGFVVYFFRDPERRMCTDEGLVYSGADGEVVAVEQITENEYFGDRRIQVSVFMSIWNVHANWYPAGGRVSYFRHHPGKYLVAWHPKSSEANERTTTVVDTGRGEVLFRQIAGFVARRIVAYSQEGMQVAQNTRCGFIKFGSRMDIILPADCEVLVMIGDRVTGSQTPVAKLK